MQDEAAGRTAAIVRTYSKYSKHAASLRTTQLAQYAGKSFKRTGATNKHDRDEVCGAHQPINSPNTNKTYAKPPPAAAQQNAYGSNSGKPATLAH